jgi:glucokinase
MDVGGTHVTVAHVDVGARRLLPDRSFREPLDGDGSVDEIPSASSPRSVASTFVPP